MIFVKLLAAAFLTVVLVLGLTTQSYGNDRSEGTGGGIGGTGHTQTSNDLLIHMNNISSVTCDQEISIGKVAVSQGASVQNKKGELICAGFELNLQKNEYLVVELKDGTTLMISGPAGLTFEANEDDASPLNYSLKMASGKVRFTRKEISLNSILIRTSNSLIELSGFDAEVILKPTTDTQYSTYVRSYSGASWLSMGKKKVAVPMGYVGSSNENLESPIVEVRKDTGQLGSRIPKSVQ